MGDTGSAGSPRDPFENLISLVAGPIAAVIRSFDQLRRGADELIKGLENFNRTMESLNATAERVNALLNEFEEPTREILTSLPGDVNQFIDELNDLVRRLAPLGQLAESASGLFGLRVPGVSRTPAAELTPPSEPSTPAAQKRTPKKTTGKRKASKPKAAKRKASGG